VQRVAADILALYCLYPSRMGEQAKFSAVREVVSWKLTDEQPDWDLVREAFSTDIGFPGIWYSAGRRYQVAFYIEFSRRMLAGEGNPQYVESCKRKADEALQAIPRDARLARHILLHLLFPDEFEHIASQRQKQAVVRHSLMRPPGNQT
jgi:5-methylcytosine-specific restriction protein B